jgi:hypothetical protein
MFSFIKWFSTFIENLKRNKGVWFTLLSLLSLAGIFISLYFVNFLVSDVAQKTYENQKNSYVLAFRNKVLAEDDYTNAIARTLAKNGEIANDFFATDENASQRIKTKLKTLEESLNTSLGRKLISVRLEEVIKREKKSGIKTTAQGSVFQSVIPMIDKNGTIVAAVVEKSLEHLATVYKREHKEFAYFLNEQSIHKIDKEFKKANYLNYHDKYYVKTAGYNKSFLKHLKSVELYEKLEENGFLKDSKYFYVYQKVYDVDGDFAGIAVVAEEVKDENSFVNLVKNLVNSVTMVALGLIVSMLLFLF